MSENPGTGARIRLDEVIHAPVRLSIAAALAKVDESEFGHLRDVLEVSDSVLSKQAGQLEAAGYLRIRKGYIGKRPRTWLSLTPDGRRALTRHIAALRAIAEGLENGP